MDTSKLILGIKKIDAVFMHARRHPTVPILSNGSMKLLGLLIPLAWACAQPAPSFEVASVKFTAHGRDANGISHSSVGSSPGSFSATNANLASLIRYAYSVKRYQISGPSWLSDDAESFDISAKPPQNAPPQEIPAMLQTLLSERFKLALHRETRVLPVYELVAAKSGVKLQPAKPGTRSGTNSNSGPEGTTLKSESLSMQGLADYLSREVDRPVYDKTGLEGFYSLQMEYGAERPDSQKPSIFSALQDALGLRLEPAKAPVEILVIDHIEKAPTEN